MTVACLAFTEQGFALACRIADSLGGRAWRSGKPLGLHDWTSDHFSTADALVYVGAVGIAVRAVAPHLLSKTTDPAVVVVDELGQYAVSLVSGHLGGANALAQRIGTICGAVPIVTTATDLHHRFAIDSWAKAQHCALLNPDRIRLVSGKLLAGQNVLLLSDRPIEGIVPKGVQWTLSPSAPCDVAVGLRFSESSVPETALRLVPRCLVLGIGCKKGVSAEQLETALQNFLTLSGYSSRSLCALATIDRKREERGLLELCRRHRLPLLSYSAAELRAVEGIFTSSPFVQSVTGVDNVCERAAMAAGGVRLLCPKQAGNGVTLALAERPFSLRF